MKSKIPDKVLELLSDIIHFSKKDEYLEWNAVDVGEAIIYILNLPKELQEEILNTYFPEN